MDELSARVLELLTGKGLALPLAVFTLLAAAVFVAASRLARHADAIADATGLGRVWIGTLLLAASTSLPELVTDVNAAAVDAVFREAGVDTMIHGHTHRPAVHRSRAGGSERSRIVLGAWHDEAHIVRWDASGWQLLPCPA